MAVRSIIFFDVKPGMAERFAAEFTGLKGAAGFPGFLGGEFGRSIREPNVFTVTALWENADAYAAWQERSRSGPPNPVLQQLIDDCLGERPEGKPYEVLHAVE